MGGGGERVCVCVNSENTYYKVLQEFCVVLRRRIVLHGHTLTPSTGVWSALWSGYNHVLFGQAYQGNSSTTAVSFVMWRRGDVLEPDSFPVAILCTT